MMVSKALHTSFDGGLFSGSLMGFHVGRGGGFTTVGAACFEAPDHQDATRKLP